MPIDLRRNAPGQVLVDVPIGLHQIKVVLLIHAVAVIYFVNCCIIMGPDADLTGIGVFLLMAHKLNLRQT